MDDGEGALSFDFEGGLDVGPTHPTASNPVTQPPYSSTAASATTVPLSTNISNPATAPPTTAASDGGTGMNSRRSYRQTVCRHWLRSLCMKGDACGFLHQYDKARMPVCRFFRLYGECREQDCVYKHTNEDIKECNMYKLGFCPNGPDCRYRHAKLPGPPPPVEEILLKIQQLTNFNYGNTNRFFHNRNNGYVPQSEKSQFPVPNGTTNQVAKSTVADSPIVQSQQGTIPSQQQTNQVQGQNFPDGKQNQASKAAAPLPQGTSRYFIVKSCNRENLDLSVQQGVWATQRSNEAKLNEAFDSVENVILIFSINRTRHFQGCAKMTSRIGGSVSGGNWKHAHGTGHYGRNFSVKWLKLCELSFHKTRHLRNPFNENLPVKISRDCQELEPSVGEQLAALLYLEPDSELMAISVAAEAKREEEKAKGINTDNRTEDPDIVPFEDNEEEEEEDEEESEEEDENFGPGYGGPGPQGRGRGRGGMMWQPLMPLARGSRPPPPGFRGFPPGIMGGDGFFGGVTPDGFPFPDISGMGPRPFGPYAPRFFGDFAGPGSGMMFHGRPQPGNFQGPGGNYGGMMMGPGRGPPFMGFGPGAQPRPGRPVGMPPFFPPQSSQQPIQNSNRSKTQRVSMNEKSDRPGSYPDQVKGQEAANSVDRLDDDLQRAKPYEQEQYGGGGNGLRNEASDSEDEAPRRSRHGEGKKKRRSSERDSANGSEV